jgi:hypothetical protein
MTTQKNTSEQITSKLSISRECVTIPYMLNFNQVSTKERCSFHRIYLKPSKHQLTMSFNECRVPIKTRRERKRLIKDRKKRGKG